MTTVHKNHGSCLHSDESAGITTSRSNSNDKKKNATQLTTASTIRNKNEPVEAIAVGSTRVAQQTFTFSCLLHSFFFLVNFSSPYASKEKEVKRRRAKTNNNHTDAQSNFVSASSFFSSSSVCLVVPSIISIGRMTVVVVLVAVLLQFPTAASPSDTAQTSPLRQTTAIRPVDSLTFYPSMAIMNLSSSSLLPLYEYRRLRFPFSLIPSFSASTAVDFLSVTHFSRRKCDSLLSLTSSSFLGTDDSSYSIFNILISVSSSVFTSYFSVFSLPTNFGGIVTFAVATDVLNTTNSLCEGLDTTIRTEYLIQKNDSVRSFMSGICRASFTINGCKFRSGLALSPHNAIGASTDFPLKKALILLTNVGVSDSFTFNLVLGEGSMIDLKSVNPITMPYPAMFLYGSLAMGAQMMFTSVYAGPLTVYTQFSSCAKLHITISIFDRVVFETNSSLVGSSQFLFHSSYLIAPVGSPIPMAIKGAFESSLVEIYNNRIVGDTMGAILFDSKDAVLSPTNKQGVDNIINITKNTVSIRSKSESAVNGVGINGDSTAPPSQFVVALMGPSASSSTDRNASPLRTGTYVTFSSNRLFLGNNALGSSSGYDSFSSGVYAVNIPLIYCHSHGAMIAVDALNSGAGGKLQFILNGTSSSSSSAPGPQLMLRKFTNLHSILVTSAVKTLVNPTVLIDGCSVSRVRITAFSAGSFSGAASPQLSTPLVMSGLDVFIRNVTNITSSIEVGSDELSGGSNVVINGIATTGASASFLVNFGKISESFVEIRGCTIGGNNINGGGLLLMTQLGEYATIIVANSTISQSSSGSSVGRSGALVFRAIGTSSAATALCYFGNNTISSAVGDAITVISASSSSPLSSLVVIANNRLSAAALAPNANAINMTVASAAAGFRAYIANNDANSNAYRGGLNIEFIVGGTSSHSSSHTLVSIANNTFRPAVSTSPFSFRIVGFPRHSRLIHESSNRYNGARPFIFSGGGAAADTAETPPTMEVPPVVVNLFLHLKASSFSTFTFSGFNNSNNHKGETHYNNSRVIVEGCTIAGSTAVTMLRPTSIVIVFQETPIPTGNLALNLIDSTENANVYFTFDKGLISDGVVVSGRVTGGSSIVFRSVTFAQSVGIVVSADFVCPNADFSCLFAVWSATMTRQTHAIRFTGMIRDYVHIDVFGLSHDSSSGGSGIFHSLSFPLGEPRGPASVSLLQSTIVGRNAAASVKAPELLALAACLPSAAFTGLGGVELLGNSIEGDGVYLNMTSTTATMVAGDLRTIPFILSTNNRLDEAYFYGAIFDSSSSLLAGELKASVDLRVMQGCNVCNRSPAAQCNWGAAGFSPDLRDLGCPTTPTEAITRCSMRSIFVDPLKVNMTFPFTSTSLVTPDSCIRIPTDALMSSPDALLAAVPASERTAAFLRSPLAAAAATTVTPAVPSVTVCYGALIALEGSTQPSSSSSSSSSSDCGSGSSSSSLVASATAITCGTRRDRLAAVRTLSFPIGLGPDVVSFESVSSCGGTPPPPSYGTSPTVVFDPAFTTAAAMAETRCAIFLPFNRTLENCEIVANATKPETDSVSASISVVSPMESLTKSRSKLSSKSISESGATKSGVLTASLVVTDSKKTLAITSTRSLPPMETMTVRRRGSATITNELRPTKTFVDDDGHRLQQTASGTFSPSWSTVKVSSVTALVVTATKSVAPPTTLPPTTTPTTIEAPPIIIVTFPTSPPTEPIATRSPYLSTDGYGPRYPIHTPAPVYGLYSGMAIQFSETFRHYHGRRFLVAKGGGESGRVLRQSVAPLEEGLSSSGGNTLRTRAFPRLLNIITASTLTTTDGDYWATNGQRTAQWVSPANHSLTISTTTTISNNSSSSAASSSTLSCGTLLTTAAPAMAVTAATAGVPLSVVVEVGPKAATPSQALCGGTKSAVLWSGMVNIAGSPFTRRPTYSYVHVFDANVTAAVALSTSSEALLAAFKGVGEGSSSSPPPSAQQQKQWGGDPTAPLFPLQTLSSSGTSSPSYVHQFTLTGNVNAPSASVRAVPYLRYAAFIADPSSLASSSSGGSGITIGLNTSMRAACHVGDMFSYDAFYVGPYAVPSTSTADAPSSSSSSVGSPTLCYTFDTVDDLHAACDKRTDCAGFTTIRMPSIPSDLSSAPRELPLCLYVASSSSSGSGGSSSTDIMGYQRMFYQKPAANVPSSGSCTATVALSGKVAVWVQQTALASGAVTVKVNGVVAGVCGQDRLFANGVSGYDGRCGVLSLCGVYTVGSASAIEVRPTSTSSSASPSTTIVGLRQNGCEHSMGVIFEQTSVDEMQKPTVTEAPIPTYNISGPSRYVVLTSAVEISKPRGLQLFVYRAASVAMRVLQSGHSCAASSSSCPNSTIALTTSSSCQSCGGANGFYGGRAGMSDRCDVYQLCGPLMNVLTSSTTSATTSSSCAANGLLTPSSSSSPTGLSGTSSLLLQPYTGFVTVNTSTASLSYAAGSSECAGFRGHVHAIPYDDDSNGVGAGSASTTSSASVVSPLAVVPVFPLRNTTTGQQRILLGAPATTSATIATPNATLLAQRLGISAAAYGLFPATLLLTAAVGSSAARIGAYYVHWEHIYSSSSSTDTSSSSSSLSSIIGSNNNLLVPNTTLVCLVDHAEEKPAECIFPIPKGSTRVKISAAQIDFASKEMGVYVHAFGRSVTATRSCGGTSTKRFIGGNAGLQEKCDQYLDCVDQYIYDRNSDADTNSGGFVKVTLPATMLPYSCGFTAKIIATFTRNADAESVPDFTGCASSAAKGEMECVGERKCIPIANVCDGVQQCASGADESQCEGWVAIPNEKLCVPADMQTVYNPPPKRTVSECRQLAAIAGSSAFSLNTTSGACTVYSAAITAAVMENPNDFVCDGGDDSDTYVLPPDPSDPSSLSLCRSKIQCHGNGQAIQYTSTRSGSGGDSSMASSSCECVCDNGYYGSDCSVRLRLDNMTHIVVTINVSSSAGGSDTASGLSVNLAQLAKALTIGSTKVTVTCDSLTRRSASNSNASTTTAGGGDVTNIDMGLMEVYCSIASNDNLYADQSAHYKQLLAPATIDAVNALLREMERGGNGGGDGIDSQSTTSVTVLYMSARTTMNPIVRFGNCNTTMNEPTIGVCSAVRSFEGMLVGIDTNVSIRSALITVTDYVSDFDDSDGFSDSSSSSSLITSPTPNHRVFSSVDDEIIAPSHQEQHRRTTPTAITTTTSYRCYPAATATSSGGCVRSSCSLSVTGTAAAIVTVSDVVRDPEDLLTFPCESEAVTASAYTSYGNQQTHTLQLVVNSEKDFAPYLSWGLALFMIGVFVTFLLAAICAIKHSRAKRLSIRASFAELAVTMSAITFRYNMAMASTESRRRQFDGNGDGAADVDDRDVGASAALRRPPPPPSLLSSPQTNTLSDPTQLIPLHRHTNGHEEIIIGRTSSSIVRTTSRSNKPSNYDAACNVVEDEEDELRAYTNADDVTKETAATIIGDGGGIGVGSAAMMMTTEPTTTINRIKYRMLASLAFERNVVGPKRTLRADRWAIAFTSIGCICAVGASFLVIYYATGTGYDSNFGVMYEEYSDSECANSAVAYMPTRIFAVPASSNVDDDNECTKMQSTGEFAGITYAAGSCDGVDGEYTARFRSGGSKASCARAAVVSVASGTCFPISYLSGGSGSPSSSTASTSSRSSSSSSARNVYVMLTCSTHEQVESRTALLQTLTRIPDNFTTSLAVDPNPEYSLSAQTMKTVESATPTTATATTVYTVGFRTGYARGYSSSHSPDTLDSQALPADFYANGGGGSSSNDPQRVVLQNSPCTFSKEKEGDQKSESEGFSGGDGTSSSLSSSDCLDDAYAQIALTFPDLSNTAASPEGALATVVESSSSNSNGDESNNNDAIASAPHRRRVRLSPATLDVPMGYLLNGYGSASQNTWENAGGDAHRYYGARGTVFDMGAHFPAALTKKKKANNGGGSENQKNAEDTIKPSDNEGYTISMYIRADTTTQGFAYAVTDAFEHNFDKSIYPLKRLGEIIANGQDGNAAWFGGGAPYKVYQSLYVNGPGKSLTFAYASPTFTKRRVHLLEYDLAEIGMERVVNGLWHHIAISLLVENGRTRAQLSVDGESSYTKPGWSVCVSEFSDPITADYDYTSSGATAGALVFDKITDLVTRGGVVVTGYFNGGIYGLRAFTTPQLNTDFLPEGTQAMRDNNPFPRQQTLVLGAVLLGLAAFFLVAMISMAVRGVSEMNMLSSRAANRSTALRFYILMLEAINAIESTTLMVEDDGEEQRKKQPIEETENVDVAFNDESTYTVDNNHHHDDYEYSDTEEGGASMQPGDDDDDVDVRQHRRRRQHAAPSTNTPALPPIVITATDGGAGGQNNINAGGNTNNANDTNFSASSDPTKTTTVDSSMIVPIRFATALRWSGLTAAKFEAMISEVREQTPTSLDCGKAMLSMLLALGQDHCNNHTRNMPPSSSSPKRTTAAPATATADVEMLRNTSSACCCSFDVAQWNALVASDDEDKRAPSAAYASSVGGRGRRRGGGGILLSSLLAWLRRGESDRRAERRLCGDDYFPKFIALLNDDDDEDEEVDDYDDENNNMGSGGEASHYTKTHHHHHHHHRNSSSTSSSPARRQMRRSGCGGTEQDGGATKPANANDPQTDQQQNKNKKKKGRVVGGGRQQRQKGDDDDDDHAYAKDMRHFVAHTDLKLNAFSNVGGGAAGGGGGGGLSGGGGRLPSYSDISASTATTNVSSSIFDTLSPIIAVFQGMGVWGTSIDFPSEYNDAFRGLYSAISVDFTAVFDNLTTLVTPLVQLCVGILVVGLFLYFMYEDNRAFEEAMTRYVWRRDALESTANMTMMMMGREENKNNVASTGGVDEGKNNHQQCNNDDNNATSPAADPQRHDGHHQRQQQQQQNRFANSDEVAIFTPMTTTTAEIIDASMSLSMGAITPQERAAAVNHLFHLRNYRHQQQHHNTTTANSNSNEVGGGGAALSNEGGGGGEGNGFFMSPAAQSMMLLSYSPRAMGMSSTTPATTSAGCGDGGISTTTTIILPPTSPRQRSHTTAAAEMGVRGNAAVPISNRQFAYTAAADVINDHHHHRGVVRNKEEVNGNDDDNDRGSNVGSDDGSSFFADDDDDDESAEHYRLRPNTIAKALEDDLVPDPRSKEGVVALPVRTSHAIDLFVGKIKKTKKRSDDEDDKRNQYRHNHSTATPLGGDTVVLGDGEMMRDHPHDEQDASAASPPAGAANGGDKLIVSMEDMMHDATGRRMVTITRPTQQQKKAIRQSSPPSDPTAATGLVVIATARPPISAATATKQQPEEKGGGGITNAIASSPSSSLLRPLLVPGVCCRRHPKQRLTPQTQTNIWPFTNAPTCCLVVNGKVCGEVAGVVYSCGKVYSDDDEGDEDGDEDRKGFAAGEQFGDHHHQGDVDVGGGGSTVLAHDGYAAISEDRHNHAKKKRISNHKTNKKNNNKKKKKFVCNYALCDRHCRLSVPNRLIAMGLGYLRLAKNRGLLWLISVAVLFLADFAYTPVMKTALMILGCHPYYQCEFDHCWDDMDQKFALAVFCCLAIVIILGVGFPLIMFLLLRARKAKMNVSFLDPAYKGKYAAANHHRLPFYHTVVRLIRRGLCCCGGNDYQHDTTTTATTTPHHQGLYHEKNNAAPPCIDGDDDGDNNSLLRTTEISEAEWGRFVTTDPTSLGQKYKRVYYKWMFYPAIAIIFKVLQLIPAIFIEPRTIEQRLGVAAVQLFVTVFVFATTTQLSPIVLMSLRAAEVHNIAILGLQNIALVVINDRNIDIGFTMIIVTAAYILFTAAVFVWTVLYPIFATQVGKIRMYRLLDRFGFVYSRAISLYLNPFAAPVAMRSRSDGDDNVDRNPTPYHNHREGEEEGAVTTTTSGSGVGHGGHHSSGGGKRGSGKDAFATSLLSISPSCYAAAPPTRQHHNTTTKGNGKSGGDDCFVELLSVPECRLTITANNQTNNNSNGNSNPHHHTLWGGIGGGGESFHALPEAEAAAAAATEESSPQLGTIRSPQPNRLGVGGGRWGTPAAASAAVGGGGSAMGTSLVLNGGGGGGAYAASGSAAGRSPGQRSGIIPGDGSSGDRYHYHHHTPPHMRPLYSGVFSGQEEGGTEAAVTTTSSFAVGKQQRQHQHQQQNRQNQQQYSPLPRQPQLVTSSTNNQTNNNSNGPPRGVSGGYPSSSGRRPMLMGSSLDLPIPVAPSSASLGGGDAEEDEEPTEAHRGGGGEGREAGNDEGAASISIEQHSLPFPPNAAAAAAATATELEEEGDDTTTAAQSHHHHPHHRRQHDAFISPSVNSAPVNVSRQRDPLDYW